VCVVEGPANINELPCLVAQFFDDDMKAMFEEHSTNLAYAQGRGDVEEVTWKTVLQDVSEGERERERQ
jgi:hypothetical protein